MRTPTKLTFALAALGLSFTATPTVEAQQTGPTITITDFIYSPDELNVKVGEPVTITNSDGFAHTVTAKDGTFDLDVPANGNVTLTVNKAGSMPYSCTYHPGQHNPAKIKVA